MRRPTRADGAGADDGDAAHRFCENMMLLLYFGWLLAPAPDGCTLFGERHRAFVRVLAVEQAVCVLGLPRERLGVIEALGFSQDLS